MAHLIDGDALLAEINKRIMDAPINHIGHQRVWAYNDVKDILSTLEVKEVDLENIAATEWNDYIRKIDGEPNNAYMLIERNQYMNLAKHFFEFGLKAKDWERKRMEECHYRQVGCTMYEGKILECRGACSWVVDYPKLKELKAQQRNK